MSSETADGRTIEAEHQVQIGLLDTLTSTVRQGGAPETIREVYDRLADYTRVHFLSEELLMRLHAYPDHELHVADHQEMLEALEAFGRAIDETRAREELPGLDRLRALLLGHIDGRDRELESHLAGSGVGG